jgi:uncharacterized metal-binding protein YceD (DUF177 family)
MPPISEPTPEFSRLVALDKIGHEEAGFDIQAEPGERTALAERFGLISIEKLTARVSLAWLKGRKAIRLTAAFHAEVTQTCVATLDPVPAKLDEQFTIVYAEAKGGSAGGEVVVSLEDETEPLVGSTLDIGEIVAEELALSLDPYPRRPGLAAGESGATAGGEGPSTPSGPFSILAGRLRKD